MLYHGKFVIAGNKNYQPVLQNVIKVKVWISSYSHLHYTQKLKLRSIKIWSLNVVHR